MRTLNNMRGDSEKQSVTFSIYFEIDRGGRIPVDVLVKVKQVRECRAVASVIGDRLGDLSILRNIPKHTLFKTIYIGIACTSIPQTHRFGKKAAITLCKRTSRVIEVLSLNLHHHVTRQDACQRRWLTGIDRHHRLKVVHIVPDTRVIVLEMLHLVRGKRWISRVRKLQQHQGEV